MPSPRGPSASSAWPDSPLRALCGACGVANFPAMAELLLERGALLDDGESLYHSLEHADTRCLEILLARGASPKRTNALHHALDVSGSERLQRLLEAGADPNEVLAAEGTVLHRAIQKGRPRTELELLLSHGADPRAKRRDGRTPLQVAWVTGHRQAAELLAVTAPEAPEAPASPFERLIEACSRGDREAARAVLDAQPDLYATLGPSDRHSFLQLVQNGNAPLVATLLAAGFPAGTRGEHGQTALHWASWHGWKRTVEVLLAHGAEVDALETEFDCTPLAWAAHGCENWPNPEGDYLGVVRLLLGAGARALGEGRLSEALLEMGPGAEEVYFLLRRPTEETEREGGGAEGTAGR